MRENKREDEIIIDKRIDKILQNEGISYSEDPNITDRPEKVIIINSKRFGIEYTGINEADIYRYEKTELDINKSKSIDLTFFPWRRFVEIISTKNDKIESYKENGNCDEIWLLIHDPIIVEENTARMKSYTRNFGSYITKWFHFICQRTNHQFQKIYYITEENHELDQNSEIKTNFPGFNNWGESEVWGRVKLGFDERILVNVDFDFNNTPDQVDFIEEYEYLENYDIDISDLKEMYEDNKNWKPQSQTNLKDLIDRVRKEK